MKPDKCGGCHSTRPAKYIMVFGCLNYHIYNARYCETCMLVAIYNITNDLDSCVCGQYLIEYEIQEIEKTR